jgi:rare lipoprotein A
MRLAAALATTALLLAACGSTPERRSPPPAPVPVPGPERSTPPPQPANLDSIPDAVPRIEPRSSRGNPVSYEVFGKRYFVAATAEGYKERGVASWYGPDFHTRATSSGEPYDMYAMTAAHKTLPIPAFARVTNLGNGRSVVVRINDRGPFVGNRIIDLSYSAAARLDMLRNGTAFVEVRTIGAGSEQTGVGTAVAADAAIAVPVRKLYIQVGAFADAANAQRVLARLQAGGVGNAFITTTARSDRLARVRLGPLASVEEFDALSTRLTGLGFGEARLAQD